MKNIKIKYSKNQKAMETYYNVEHIPIYTITRDKIGEYILYQINSMGNLTKMKTGQTPVKLDEYATEQMIKGVS